jgi:hypothetical protein
MRYVFQKINKCYKLSIYTGNKYCVCAYDMTYILVLSLKESMQHK